MNSIIFFPILLIVIVLLFGYQMMNRKKGAIMIGRNIHFKIVVIFIAALFVTTVIAEAYHSKIDSAIAPKVVENHQYEAYYQIEDEIINHGSVDPDLLLEKRTHPAGKTLTIQWEKDSYHNYHQSIYIERKAPGDQTIEEFIYRPMLIANEFDFSHVVNVPKPIWSEYKMVIPKKPVDKTITFTSYHEVALLQQLTKTQRLQSDDYGFSSEYRPLIIHLKVPADLEVLYSEDESPYFIDE